ncbi:MAG: Rap1a/Tai family immunity protein [Parvibaculum sp.]|nr:Rap1a/Tai family immunity protein [Parvibaculum sp.]
MKTKTLVAALIFFVAPVLGTPAFAGLPTEPEDIRTGDDLAAACKPLVEHDVSEEGELAAKACSGFLGSMVQKVYEATESGRPTTFSRIGPKQETTLCFQLPDQLSFVDFAKLLLSYRAQHPELDDRPAYETGAWTLAVNFPCPKDKAP